MALVVSAGKMGNMALVIESLYLIKLKTGNTALVIESLYLIKNCR